MREIYLRDEEDGVGAVSGRRLQTGSEGGRSREVACVARAASVLIFPWLDRMAGVSFLFTTAPEGGVVAVAGAWARWTLCSSTSTNVLTAGAASRSTLRTEESTQSEDDLLRDDKGSRVASASVSTVVVSG